MRWERKKQKKYTEKEKLLLFDKRVKKLLDCKFLQLKGKLELVPTGEKNEELQ